MKSQPYSIRNVSLGSTVSLAMLVKGVKLLRGTCLYFWKSSLKQQTKKSICGVYHFLMNKFYCGATVKEKSLFFSVPASMDGNSWGI